MRLRSKLELGAKKLRLDEEDMVVDILHYYKNPQFIPEKGLQMCLKAILNNRHWWSNATSLHQCFSAIAEGKDGTALFRGDSKVPIFSNAHVLTSILGGVRENDRTQSYSRRSWFSLSRTCHLCTQNPQVASLKVSVLVIKNQPPPVFIEKVIIKIKCL